MQSGRLTETEVTPFTCLSATTEAFPMRSDGFWSNGRMQSGRQMEMEITPFTWPFAIKWSVLKQFTNFTMPGPMPQVSGTVVETGHYIWQSLPVHWTPNLFS
eukprot:Pompholyxophrys_punicea_v1_NODE_21_length_5692_cov_19.735675.p7 type:complete len:102 gc:universal NODE_21_length_5692_cov_19.735675:2516-2211(-)